MVGETVCPSVVVGKFPLSFPDFLYTDKGRLSGERVLSDFVLGISMRLFLCLPTSSILILSGVLWHCTDTFVLLPDESIVDTSNAPADVLARGDLFMREPPFDVDELLIGMIA